MKYSCINYRQNIVRYWRQFFPDYNIPDHFHVHHIVPRHKAKKLGWTDEKINHPRNLIVVHPVEHWSIHEAMGDYLSSLRSLGQANKGRKMSAATKRKIGDANRGRLVTQETRDKLSKSRPGFKHTASTKKKMAKAKTGKHNPKFKGWYITPWGKFESSYAASTNEITYRTVNKWCNNPDTIITRQSATLSKLLSSDDIGKTFGELGFNFVGELP